jgi:glycosyltransferase involved in cell wall biosynthesis
MDSFVLVVGRLNVRKNLAVAIEAALASGRVDSRNPMVIIGEPDGRPATFPERVKSAIADGSVRFTGFVSSSQLAWAYRRTSAFVLPSRDEGFGIPAIEALAFGAPVVASDIEVFRELLGDRAVFADPDDPQAMAEAMRTVLDRSAGDGRPLPVSPATLEYDWPNVVEKLRRRIAGVLEQRVNSRIWKSGQKLTADH